jgi:drug/metabolite transporter (DMT)-like permease
MKDTHIMRTWAWIGFWILGLIWGSSFLLIRVGVEEIPSAQLVFIRTLIAAVGLTIVALLRGKHFPTDRRTWSILALIGLVNATLPYFFIGLGEQVVASSVASIFQSTVNLFSLVFAHFVLADERITVNKFVGLILGFIGVVILSIRPGEGEQASTFLGPLAIVIASALYGAGAVFTKRTVSGRIEPIVIAAGSFIPAALFAFPLMYIEPLIGGRAPVDLFALRNDVIASALMLGFLNTFVAYLFFYFIIQQLGAFRATNVTYIVPVVGVFLGWLVLDEVIDLQLILGAVLIFAGLGFINLPRRRLPQFRTVTAPSSD